MTEKPKMVVLITPGAMRIAGVAEEIEKLENDPGVKVVHTDDITEGSQITEVITGRHRRWRGEGRGSKGDRIRRRQQWSKRR